MSYYGDRYDRLEWSIIKRVSQRFGLSIDVAREIVKFVVKAEHFNQQRTYEDWRDD